MFAANYLYKADEVSYTPKDTSWNVDSVDKAINDLYGKTDGVMKIPTETKDITKNGTDIDVTNYAKVNVDVATKPKYIFGYGGYSTTSGGGSATYSWWYIKNNMESYSSKVVEWTSGYNYEDEYVKVSGSGHSRSVFIKKNCIKVQGETTSPVSENTIISSSGFYSITPFFLIFEK